MPSLNKKAQQIPFYLTKKVSEGAAGEPGVVNLSRGQAGFLPSQKIYEEAKKLITREDKTIFRYEKTAGASDLRQSIADWYGRKFNLEVNPNYVAVTPGGTGAISLTLQNFTSLGDQVVIPDPSYPFYTLATKHGLEGREITRLVMGTEKVDRSKLEAVVMDNMQMVLLTSPHNPTGVVYDEKTLRGVLDLAKERDFFVFYDENHFPEVYDDNQHIPIHKVDKERTNSIMLGSISRLALQGERIGWAVLPNVSEEVAQTFVAQSPFASTRSQRLARFVLDNYEDLGFDEEIADYNEKRNWLVPRLNKLGFECPMPQGTSYVFPNIKRLVEKNRGELSSVVVRESKARDIPQEEIQMTLQHPSMLVYKYALYEAKVGIVPGIAYGPSSDDNVRFTFSVPREELEEAISKLEKAFS